ncbi:MAG: hypothetical protein R3181_11070 [Rubricoccaceae bacterium]|nr:hypothetical protein [Rubricoccaceae bacterium]
MTTASFGWLAVVGIAALASAALLRHSRLHVDALHDVDDLLVRIYS